MGRIFLDFTLPTAGTWFYFSLLLAVAAVFQFHRLLALRNWDLLALYLFVPGFLLLQQPHADSYFGYWWLLAASFFWLVRCLLDGVLARRPVFRSNLNLYGLSWLGLMLFLGLSAAAVRKPADDEAVGKAPAAIGGVTSGAAVVVDQTKTDDGYAAAREWVGRGLAIAGHLAVVLGLLFVGVFHFREPETGLAMGTLYLLLPYTAYHFGQVHHVLPTALLVWAVFAFRVPWLSGLLLGLAAGSSFFPLLLFPVWLHFYRRRGAGRFAAGFFTAAGVGLAATVLILWAAGALPGGLLKQLHLSDWQPWQKTTGESIWTSVHWAYRLPVFLGYAVFVALTFVWPPVRTVGHVVAASAAVLIGVQFWYADRGGLYVLWYAPLLLLMVYRPAGVELEPPVRVGRGWARRALAAGWRRVRGTETPTGIAA